MQSSIFKNKMSDDNEVLGQDIDFIFENLVGGNSYWQWYIVLKAYGP